MQLVVVECRFHRDGASRTPYAEVPGHQVAICARTARQSTSRELHGPRECLFHLREAAVFVYNRRKTSHVGRLFASEITAGIQAVDYYVHQWTAPGQFLVETPFIWCDGKTKRAFDRLDGAQLPRPNELHGAQIRGFILAAIRNHELLASA